MPTTQQVAYFFCIVLLVSILASKFLMTVAMLGLVTVGLFHLSNNKSDWRNFFTNKAFLALSGIFFIVLLSGSYSTDQAYFFERLRIKLPFLVLPFVFALLPSFNKRQYYSILYLLLALMSIISVGVLANYLLHFDAYNIDIQQSRSIPTPIHHIRYSLLTTLAILSGFVLLKDDFYLFNRKWERLGILLMTVFLFVFIHILSVRSGILALYCLIFVLALQYIFSTRRYFLGGSILVALFLLPMAAYFLIPSFQTQIHLTIHNYNEFQQGKLDNYSDTQRMASYVAGLKAVEGHTLLGVGMGDVRQEVKLAYSEIYPNLTYKLPHNQFLFFFVGTGLLGLIGFVFCFSYPLFYQKKYRDPLFLGLYVIVFCSFMVEATIETAVGTAFYIFFVLVGLKEPTSSTCPNQN